jgi:hypothetical protein
LVANRQHRAASRYAPALAFDAARSRLVLFGGRTNGNVAAGDTWVLTWPGVPSFSTHPVPQTSYSGDQAVFTAQLTSSGSATLRWRKDGVELVDGGRFAGVTTPTLTINYVEYGDAGTYDVVATNQCGTIPSGGAVLTVLCYANCDASTISPTLNVADFTCFLQRFASGDPYANCDHSPTPPSLNVADFTCYLQRFVVGCP